MKVRVNGKWTYECPFDVAVGDLVVLPSAHNKNGTWVGEITAVNDDGGYKGRCKEVIGPYNERDETDER